MFIFYLYVFIECRDGDDDEEKNNGFLTCGQKGKAKLNITKPQTRWKLDSLTMEMAV